MCTAAQSWATEKNIRVAEEDLVPQDLTFGQQHYHHIFQVNIVIQMY